MFNVKVVINVLGLLVVISGLAMLTSLPFSWYFGSDDFYPILFSGLGTVLLGGLVWLLTKNGENRELKKRDGYLGVTAGWIVMSLVGAIPYVAAGAVESYTDAFFETMSGFTTTGATILGQGIEELPPGLHVWRAMTHWIGGMGIIVLTIAILPLLGIGGMQLYAAEVPGPTPDKLTPRIKETAKRLWIIYVGLTAVEVVLLMLGDMNFYEAICHSMGTLSTGGFSTRQGSVGEFSPYVQYIITLFMFLAGTNFALTYFALRGKPMRLWENEGIHSAVPVGARFLVEQVPFLSTIKPDEVMIVQDVRLDPRVDPQTREILEGFGMRSFVLYPLVAGNQWLGLVAGQSTEPIFTEDIQIRRASSLVGQAAVVIQTTLLFRHEQARARREQLLREIAAKVRSSTDVDSIMRTAVTEIGRTLGRRAFIKLSNGQLTAVPEENGVAL